MWYRAKIIKIVSVSKYIWTMSCQPPQSYTKEAFSSPPFLLSFWARCKSKTEREGDTKSGLCEMGLVTVFRQQGSKDGGMWGAERCACVCGGECLSSGQLRRKLSGRGHMTAVVMTSKRHPMYNAQPCSSPDSQRLRLSSTLNLHFHSPNMTLIYCAL